MKRILSSFVFVLAASMASGQSPDTEHTLRLDEGAPRPPASIEDIAWLAGSWQGEAFGGRFEDVWTAPSAGTMMGMFKVFQGDEPSFYELQLLVEEEGSLTWKVKHFAADFSAWEERSEFVAFPLVRIEADAAYFAGLTLRRAGPDELRVFLSMNGPDGRGEVAMVYRRAMTAGEPKQP